MKCSKRRERRRQHHREQQQEQQQQDTDRCNDRCQLDWSCPFDNGFLNKHLPPPLPFHRRRRGCRKSQQAQQQQAPSHEHGCRGGVVDTTQSKQPGDSHTPSKPDTKRSQSFCVEAAADRTEETSTKRCQNLPQSPTHDDGCTKNTSTSTATASTGAATDVATSADSTTMKHQQEQPQLHRADTAPNELTSKPVSAPSPTVMRTSLMDLARMQQWPELLSRVNKKEAKRCDADGLYPLHWACSGGAPLEVVEALIKAYPRAVRKLDRQGSTVLHFACHYGASAAVIDLLIQKCPKAAVQAQDQFGRTPLFHAVSKSASMDVIQRLVDADPAMIANSCPLTNRALRHKTKIRKHTPLLNAWCTVLKDSKSRERASGKKWDKAVYLLREAYLRQEQQSNGEMFRLIPAVIKFLHLLPLGVLDLVVRLFPSQLTEEDPISGLLPLALAASTVRPHQANRTIEILLSASPNSALEVDRQGRSALAMALASGKRWQEGVEQLFRAAPQHIYRTRRDLPLVAICAAASSPSCQNDDQQQHQEAEKIIDQVESIMMASPFAQQNQKEKDECNKSSPASLPLLLHGHNNDDDDDNRCDNKNDCHANPAMAHLSTVYQLLLADPSAVAVNNI